MTCSPVSAPCDSNAAAVRPPEAGLENRLRMGSVANKGLDLDDYVNS